MHGDVEVISTLIIDGVDMNAVVLKVGYSYMFGHMNSVYSEVSATIDFH